MARGSTLKQIKRLAAKVRKTKRVRRPYLRHRNTTVGRVLPPIDIRSPSGLGDALARIRKGPVTIILVYADWCGHCTKFKPIFKNAEKSPNRTVQSVSVNDVMFPQMTDAIKHRLNRNATPMSVEGYPTLLLVDKKGNIIKNVAAVNDPHTITSLMEKAGTLAATAESMNNSGENPTAPESMNNSGENPPVIQGKSLPPLRAPKNSIAPSASVPSVSANFMKRIRSPSSQSGSLEEEQSMTESPEIATSVSPPIAEIENDIINNSANSANSANYRRQGGGGLLAALGTSAYQLAPAGVLLALAASTMKRRKSKSVRKAKTQRRRR